MTTDPVWLEALDARADGILIDVEVVPGAATSQFPSGYNVWRKRLQARVQAPPTEGRANDELRTLVAERFDVMARQVVLVDGATSRQKRFLVQAVSRDEAVRRLSEVLDARG